MKELTEKPNPPETGSASQKPRSKPGRKGLTSKASRTRAGQGGVRLRAAVNKMVADESKRIAKALVDKTCDGNMTIGQIVFELSGVQQAALEAKKKKKKTKTSLYIKQLCSEPEWTGPWEDEDGHRDASKLPPSDYDLPADLK
jgi:hypothetical protein